MAKVPELPPVPGGRPRRPGVRRARALEPARYVAGLLLWQGIGWLVLSATGLGFWIASLPASLNVYSYGAAVLWTWVELLAIAVGLSLGAAEIGMSCRLRGGPKSVVAVATGFHGVTLAAGLVVAAVSVMIAGSVLELLALNGTFLPRAPSSPAARKGVWVTHARCTVTASADHAADGAAGI
jgi:hypothetical protein